MADTPNYQSYIDIDGFEQGDFSVVSWNCTEALSELSFLTAIVHAPLDIDTFALVRKNVRILVRGSGGDTADLLEIPAMITAVSIDAANAPGARCTLVLTLRSRFFALTLVKASRVFLEKSVKEIIAEVLEGDGFVEGNDFEFKLKETYDPYEYTVQYQETDFDFISRLMEDEGIYYYMSDRALNAGPSGELKDYLVILDSSEFHPEKKIVEPDTSIDIPYRPANPTNPGGDGVGYFAMDHKLLPKDVLLKDYNYRKPTVEMKGTAPASEKGFGTYYSYGDHFKTPDEGNALAKIRAEEILCRVKVWQGMSVSLGLEPGVIFNLVDHPYSEWNGRYIITSISHSGYQPGAGLAPPSVIAEIGYSNTFTAIKADTQFRPERVTPKPKIAGVMHATIDAGASGEYAELDDMGRYKVKLPFDLSDIKDGKASRYVRMAQPYSGPGMGMHFPLHKGTEVLLIHMDGDPDRPLIVGSVPNPDTASPVSGANQSQCAVLTGGGNQFVIEDQDGKQSMKLSTPSGKTSISIGIG